MLRASPTTWRRGHWSLAVTLACAVAACGQSRRTVESASGPATGGATGGGGSGGTSDGSGGSRPATGEAGETTRPGAAGQGDEPCPEAVVPTSQLPRLTAAEYDKTLRDLLGVIALDGANGAAPSSLLAPDSSGDVTDRDWAAYLAAAEAVAAQVLADPALKTRFIDCAPGVDTSACLHDTIVGFGRRAFRRPLTEAEVARFEAIGARATELTEHGTLDEVAEVILQTFLVSPSFLQRAEISEPPDGNGNYALSSFEVAARLSYYLWGSTPDASLAAAADAGALSTQEQILAQAERLIAAPEVRDRVKAFHRYYLGTDFGSRWLAIEKNAERFPAFTTEAASVAREETDRFFEGVAVDAGGTFADLLTSPLAFVNASTAPLYGLEAGPFGTSLEPVTLDPAERPGFLTRLGFLAAYAYWERTAPQLRGAFLMKQVLGAALGVHPPDVDGQLLPNDPSLDTVRKLVTAQDAGAVCVPCHATLDPPGFVLEAFDAVGAHQTADATTGAPIDTEADVTIDGQTVHVRNPAELMQRLAVSRDARRRYAERWVSFTFQREDTRDACLIDELAESLGKPTYGVLSAPRDLTTTTPFRVRAVEVP